MTREELTQFYKAKKVLVTGHTGFKGTWLCMMLEMLGAEVIGYALEPVDEENLFAISHMEENINSVIGDIRDLVSLDKVFAKYQPEIVFHLAAQPIVRESYEKPVDTYETNVMGTVNVLECVRKHPQVKAVLNVTTDKVYENKEWEWGYRENEMLDGYDPYSNSKSCSELVTHCYQRSFLETDSITVSTARAGNVIGGGDFAKDRIVPDCIRAAARGEIVILRNPNSIRPFQHVIEPLTAYMMIVYRQWKDKDVQGNYNVGPDEANCVTTGQLASVFCDTWGNGLTWQAQCQNGPHEANFLKLDCSRIKEKIGWKPVWQIEEAIKKTVQWEKEYLKGESMRLLMQKQILEYLKCQFDEEK